MSRKRQGTILLASSSPRRREILDRAGYRFQLVTAPDVNEASTGIPGRLAIANARLKARAADQALTAGQVLLGSDTVVAIDGDVMGKPKSRADAKRMLTKLSGSWHRVVTGICLRDASGLEAVSATTTRVRFRSLPGPWLRDYLSAGEGDDKAGAYGIQGAMAVHVDRISGCYFNVMGLSPASVWTGLEALGRSNRDFLCPPANS